MAPKRPFPEQFAQPARKCRRIVDYAAQQNESEDDTNSDDEFGSEFETTDEANISEAEEDEAGSAYKDTSSTTKRIALMVNKAMPPARRIIRPVIKVSDAKRKDSAISNNLRQQANISTSRSKSTLTLAENKPWVPLIELEKHPEKRFAEGRPWVPLYPSPPASTEKPEWNDESDSDDDDDDDDDRDDDDDDNKVMRSSSGQTYTIPKPIFSIMDPRNPKNPANFRSCMEDLPEEESDDEKISDKPMRDEASESGSSEYTGEEEDESDEDDRDENDM